MSDHEPIPFSITASTKEPIYLQLMDQVRRSVVSGALSPGDWLPSVRAVAQYLKVNAMTVSKAYSMLQAEGILERVRGQRTRVRPRPEQTPVDRTVLLRPLLERAVREARELKLDDRQVLELVSLILDDVP